ncbi:MAG TPA: NDP-sugar synthase, partial [Pyrinomonadaceae bacterium]|nr:NDP-sugar synthase [Pyrinomonadaceae bacterium]
PQILGTSGALDNARDLLSDSTFIVINGKIITDIDLSQALETHQRTHALATLVLLPNIKRERFSVVDTANGCVRGFLGMPGPDCLDAPLMFTGIQILEPRIFEYIPRGVFSHSTTDVYPRAISEGHKIAAHVAQGRWFELSTIWRYLEISLTLLAESGEDYYRGRNCTVSEHARVTQSILWDNVLIGAGARLNRAILGDGVRIDPGEVIEESAVVAAALVKGKSRPEKAQRGEFRGNNFVVPIMR